MAILAASSGCKRLLMRVTTTRRESAKSRVTVAAFSASQVEISSLPLQ